MISIKQSLLTIPIALAMITTIVSSMNVLGSHSRVKALDQNEIDPAQHAQMLISQSRVRNPGEWIRTATLLVSNSTENDALAIQMLQDALAIDRHDPRAWALLSFLRVRHAGILDEEAETALQNSIQVCGYCDADLMRWRLMFTLQNWEDVSEKTRLAVFSGADFLRWWHLDYEYLEGARDSARTAGIPFDEYRKRVGTAVRPNEIGL